MAMPRVLLEQMGRKEFAFSLPYFSFSLILCPSEAWRTAGLRYETCPLTLHQGSSPLHRLSLFIFQL